MTTYDPEDQGRAPSCRRAAAGILADLAMRVRGPKFVNVDRAQLNSQNFCSFPNRSWTRSSKQQSEIAHHRTLVEGKDSHQKRGWPFNGRRKKEGCFTNGRLVPEGYRSIINRAGQTPSMSPLPTKATFGGANWIPASAGRLYFQNRRATLPKNLIGERECAKPGLLRHSLRHWRL